MNAFTQFLAARAAKGAKPVVNADTPVSRAEFNTLSQAVAGLIEDFDAVASPDKLAAVINAAMTEVVKDVAPTLVNARDRSRLAPSDDELAAPTRRLKTDTVANAGRTARKALALPADRLALAPKGE